MLARADIVCRRRRLERTLRSPAPFEKPATPANAGWNRHGWRNYRRQARPIAPPAGLATYRLAKAPDPEMIVIPVIPPSRGTWPRTRNEIARDEQDFYERYAGPEFWQPARAGWIRVTRALRLVADRTAMVLAIASRLVATE
jgi:hypothetical protein